jgi:hypothetical protein
MPKTMLHAQCLPPFSEGFFGHQTFDITVFFYGQSSKMNPGAADELQAWQLSLPRTRSTQRNPKDCIQAHVG